MNKIKPISLIINCLVISAICFAVGYKSAGMLYSSVTTNNTIISEIWSLEKDLRIEKEIKTYYEKQMSYMDEDLANTELDEHERLMSFAKKKDLEQSLKESERKIEKLTKKINKSYERLRKRNPEFKGAVNE